MCEVQAYDLQRQKSWGVCVSGRWESLWSAACSPVGIDVWGSSLGFAETENYELYALAAGGSHDDELLAARSVYRWYRCVRFKLTICRDRNQVYAVAAGWSQKDRRQRKHSIIFHFLWIVRGASTCWQTSSSREAALSVTSNSGEAALSVISNRGGAALSVTSNSGEAALSVTSNRGGAALSVTSNSSSSFNRSPVGIHSGV